MPGIQWILVSLLTLYFDFYKVLTTSHRVSIEPCEPSVLSEMQMPILNQWKDGLLEVDDENILEDRVLPQPKHRTTLATGLKALTRLYEIASETMRLGHAIESERALGSLNPTSTSTRSPSDRQKILDRLREGFERQKHALDNMPPEFDEWTSTGNNTAHHLNRGEQADPITIRQFEILRANIRVTHLWLQSVIFEDIVSLATDGIINVKDNKDRTPGAQTQKPSDITLRGLWDDRENICRQLLQVLYNISHENLEPNGASLVHKIRVVAATLIDCPFELQGSIARQAHSYIQAFANVLSTLDPADDGAYARDVWTNLDQHKRLSVSDFAYSPR